jgi:4-amino-4-deoxy-L-arabinose transferase-like glycosyltransferase
MLATDNWTLPRNNGGEMAYKPPFFHWCVAAVSAIGGQVTEATSRIPSAIALIVMTLWGVCFFRKRTTTRTAMLAALIAFTSFELHRAGANCRVDMVLTMLTVCALYLLYRWYENGLHGIPLLAILLMGLGTLTKGPVGSIIPCMVIGCVMLLRGVNFFKTFFLLLTWGLLSLIPYAILFYFAWQQGGQEFLDLMYEENI